MLEIILDCLGYSIIIGVLATILYIFYKILAQGFSAFRNNDD